MVPLMGASLYVGHVAVEHPPLLAYAIAGDGVDATGGGGRGRIPRPWTLHTAYVDWTAEEEPAHQEHTEAHHQDRSRHGGAQQARQLPSRVIHHLETELLHIAGERLALR